MAAVIQLNVKDTGRSGKVWVDVVTPGPMDVNFLYTVDTFGAPEIGTWESAGSTFSAPGSLTLTLPADQWVLLQAIGVYDGQLEVSPVQRVQPLSNVPYYSIDVSREAISDFNVANKIAYRLRMQASNAVNMSNNIFLYEKVPAEALSLEVDDNFVAVCKPGDLETYPIDEPLEAQEYPFYRLPVVDLLEENIFKLEETADAILGDVRLLMNSLEANRELELQTVYQITSGSGRNAPKISTTVAVPGLPQQLSGIGRYVGGNSYRYSFSDYTWLPDNPTSVFLSEDAIDSSVNPTILAHLVQNGGQEITIVGSYAGTVNTYGHQYSFASPVAMTELLWVEAIYL